MQGCTSSQSGVAFRSGVAAVRQAHSRPGYRAVEKAKKCAVRAGSNDGSVQASSVPEVRDKFVARVLENCVQEGAAEGLEQLRSSCLGVFPSLYMPTTRNEDYRFTDMSFIMKSDLQAPPSESKAGIQLPDLSEETSTRVAFVDGVVDWEASKIGTQDGVYIGPLGDIPHAIGLVGTLTDDQGGPFSVLNGALARDALVISVDANVKVDKPIYISYQSSGAPSGFFVNAPRVLVVCQSESSLEIVEECQSLAESSSNHLTIPIIEIVLGDDVQMVHKYAQLEGQDSVHMKGTLVSQGTRSNYQLTEASVGGKLSRHDVWIAQQGEETIMTMDHFLVCGDGQLHDLHSRVALNHPRGTANQLHKCIVTHPTSRGVFDGNVKVNQLAQQTDAGQLSRNLLIVPKATVNVKPNLQIIADDVKCTHGCTVSDLSDEEIFYFRARGVDEELARRALIVSFGTEIVQKFEHKFLLERIQSGIEQILESAGML